MMLRENPISGNTTKGESIDACMRGGSSRISDEVLVMRMERRGCANPKGIVSNRYRRESIYITCVVLELRGAERKVGRSRMNREVHVRSL